MYPQIFCKLISYVASIDEDEEISRVHIQSAYFVPNDDITLLHNAEQLFGIRSHPFVVGKCNIILIGHPQDLGLYDT